VDQRGPAIDDPAERTAAAPADEVLLGSEMPVEAPVGQSSALHHIIDAHAIEAVRAE
jgi:hypothetical protein